MYKISGYKLPYTIIREIAMFAYAEKGVTGISEYYDVTTGTTEELDPLAECVGPELKRLCDNFDSVYKHSDWDRVLWKNQGNSTEQTDNIQKYDKTTVEYLYLPAEDSVIYQLRDKFSAVCEIEECESVDAYTRLFANALDLGYFNVNDPLEIEQFELK